MRRLNMSRIRGEGTGCEAFRLALPSGGEAYWGGGWKGVGPRPSGLRWAGVGGGALFARGEAVHVAGKSLS